MPYASIDAHRKFVFKVDPYDISWGYTLRTQTTDTYGGKVIQILGVELTNLTIETVAGGEGYPYLQEMREFFREMGLWQQENQLPATFNFPPKDYTIKFWGQRFTFQNSLDNVVYPVQITGAIQEDLGGNLKTSLLTAELQRLAEGIGYTKNIYNDPTQGAGNTQALTDLRNLNPDVAAAQGTPGAGAGTQTVAIPDDKVAETVINRALSQLGVTYAWGGGDANGPTQGIRDGGVADAHGDFNKIGFDCSGLVVYAYAGVGVDVPHQTQSIAKAYGHITDKSQVVPGDCLEYSNNGELSGVHHVGIYMGPQDNGTMIEAPQSGDVVKVSTNVWSRDEFVWAVRPR